MKTKHLVILIVIFSALLAGVLIKKNQKAPELATEEYTSLDLAFDEAQVSKIVIEKAAIPPEEVKKEEKESGSHVEIAKRDQRWVVSSLWNARADESKIRDLFKEIRNAKGELRSRDKALLPDFGMDPARALHVVLSGPAGAEILALDIGTKTPDSYSAFVRKKGADAVYLTQASFFSRMGIYGDPSDQGPSGDYWAARNLLEFDPEKVEKIQTTRFYDGAAAPAAAVSRTNDASDSTKKFWAFDNAVAGFGLDAEKIKKFLEEFKTWSAEKVLDPKARDYGFSRPVWQMKLALEGGREVTLTAAREEAASSAVFIQSSADPVVFQLSKYYFENMDVDDSRFIAGNFLGVDPDKTEKLVIHADQKEMTFKPAEKKWDALTEYLQFLKDFRMERFISNPKEKKPPKPGGAHWVEIQKQGGASQFLDVGDAVAAGRNERPAAIRAKSEPFVISEAMFKALFENLDRLAEPKPAPALSATSPPSKK